MGYTEYKCDNCDDSYIGDYTDKAEHDYKKSVTAPSCTAMVDHSSLVIAVWNGLLSGTKNTIDYAKRKNVETINLLNQNNSCCL